MSSAWKDVFTSLLGENAVIEVDPRNPNFRGAELHLQPASKEALIAVVTAAHRDHIPLRVFGGNTAPSGKSSADAPHTIVAMQHLDRIVEHAAEDLTFTAEAGLTLGRAQAHVASSGQQLPLSPPHPDRATLGGIVSAATEGPSLKAYGRVRDQVLGIELLTWEGELTKAGGRVVKNVTGYDLCRLYTGARGHFGIVTQITFRLRALERAGCTLIWTFENAERALASGRALRREIVDFASLHLSKTTLDSEPQLIARIRGEEAFVEALAKAAFSKPRGELRSELLPRTTLDDFLTSPFHPLATGAVLPSKLQAPEPPYLLDLETGLVRTPRVAGES